MALESLLERWVGAGLIDAEQAARIRRFEAEQSRPTLLYAAATLAGVAIGIGIVSIVAANWDAIPGRAKIGIDLVAIAGLSYAVVPRERFSSSWLREAGLVVLYAGVLASIALIGQVYQLGGNAAAALLAWSVLTFPALAQGRSAALGFIWLAGLETSYFVAWSKLAERGPEYAAWGVSAAYWAPVVCLALGGSAWLQRSRPALAGVARAAGWAQLVLAGSAGSLILYFDPPFSGSRALWLGAAVSAAATAWLAYREGPGPRANARRWLLAGALATAELPLLVPHGKWSLVGFLGFLALWWLVAVAAYRSGSRRVLHLATAVLALRLLIGYVELFGSLLETGLGLVFGGVLALLLIWVWTRQRRSWDQQLRASGGPPAASREGEP